MRGESAGFAAGGKHSMARDDERNRIFAQRLSDGSGRVGAVQSPSDLAVSPGLAGGNGASGGIDLPGEVTGFAQVEDNVLKILRIAAEVFAYPKYHPSNFRRRIR